MPINDVRKIIGVPVKKEQKGHTLQAYPATNGLQLFMNFCVPAWEALPKEVEGTLVEVEIPKDED